MLHLATGKKNPPTWGESSYNLKDYIRFSYFSTLSSYKTQTPIDLIRTFAYASTRARGASGLEDQPWMEPLSSQQANNGLVAQ